MKNLLISLLLCILAMGAQAQRQPRLEHRDNSTARIVVNDRPMLMIGGELGNSCLDARGREAYVFASPQDGTQHCARSRVVGVD